MLNEVKCYMLDLKTLKAVGLFTLHLKVKKFFTRKSIVDKYEFRVGKKGDLPRTEVVFTAGAKLNINNFSQLPDDVRTILKVKNQKELDEVINSEAFRNNKEFMKWADENFVGKIEFQKANGETVIFANPSYVNKTKEDVALNLANKKIEQGLDEGTIKHRERMEKDPEYRSKAELKAKNEEVAEFAERTQQKAKTLAEGTPEGLSDDLLQVMVDNKAKIDNAKVLRDKIGGRLETAEELLAEMALSKTTSFKGGMLFTSDAGRQYTIQRLLDGEDGESVKQYAYAHSVLGQNLNRMDELTYRTARGINGYTNAHEIVVGNPYYYRDYTSHLMFNGRTNSGFVKAAEILNNSKRSTKIISEDEAIEPLVKEFVDWLKTTPEGKRFAAVNKIGKKHTKLSSVQEEIKKTGNIEDGVYMSYEEYAEIALRHVSDELFDDDVLKLFLSKNPATGQFVDLTEASVKKALQGKELRNLTGVSPEQGRANNTGLMRATNNLITKINNVFVEQPQMVLEMLPMAQAYYMRTMRGLINANEASLGRALTVEEINGLSKQARRDGIEEMRKWIYNVQSKWNVTEALSLIIPFITAITFTAKMVGRAIKEQPEQLLWTISQGTKALGEFAYVDSNGNPVSAREAWKPGSGNYMMIQLHEDAKKILNLIPGLEGAGGGVKQARISLRSMNVWFQQEWVPGPGPIVTLPANFIARQFPMDTFLTNETYKDLLNLDIMKWALNFGSKEDYLQLVLPTWLNQGLDFFTFGRQYQDAFSKIMAFEAARYRLNPEQYQMPREEEIKEKVAALFALQITSSTVGFFGVGFKIETELDYYRKIHRQLVEQYGKNEADWIMLTKYPEFVGATLSVTDNRYNINTNIDSFFNIEKNPNAVELFQYAGEGAKDIMGWAMNPRGAGLYSEYVWQYLTQEEPGVGADKFRRILSAEEITRKAAAAPAWIMYNKFHDVLDAHALSNGAQTWREDELSKRYRTQFIRELKQDNPEWASEYSDANFNRYNERALALSFLVNDPQWLSTAGTQIDDVEIFRQFVQVRGMIQNDLLSQGLTLGRSKQHRMYYDTVIAELKRKSINFSVFYNRYFGNESF
jgi:hypothetical protein